MPPPMMQITVSIGNIAWYPQFEMIMAAIIGHKTIPAVLARLIIPKSFAALSLFGKT